MTTPTQRAYTRLCVNLKPYTEADGPYVSVRALQIVIQHISTMSWYARCEGNMTSKTKGILVSRQQPIVGRLVVHRGRAEVVLLLDSWVAWLRANYRATTAQPLETVIAHCVCSTQLLENQRRAAAAAGLAKSARSRAANSSIARANTPKPEPKRPRRLVVTSTDIFSVWKPVALT